MCGVAAAVTMVKKERLSSSTNAHPLILNFGDVKVGMTNMLSINLRNFSPIPAQYQFQVRWMRKDVRGCVRMCDAHVLSAGFLHPLGLAAWLPCCTAWLPVARPLPHVCCFAWYRPWCPTSFIKWTLSVCVCVCLGFRWSLGESSSWGPWVARYPPSWTSLSGSRLPQSHPATTTAGPFASFETASPYTWTSLALVRGRMAVNVVCVRLCGWCLWLCM